MSRRTVSQWFALAALGIGLVTAIGAAIGIYAIVRLDDARHVVVERNGPAALAASRLSNALLNQETGVRGFALAGDERFLAPYRTGRAEAEEALAELRARLDDGELRAHVARVEVRMEAWARSYARPTIALVRRDGPDAPGLPSAGTGRRLFGDVRVAAAGLDREIAEVSLKGRADLASAAGFLSGAFVAIVVLIALGIVGVGLRLRRVVDREEHMLLHDAHAQLDAQARELQRSNAELEQFAYVASHDLQEPLRKVASFCQLLEQRYGDQLDERGRQYVDFAVDGAKRMQQLINDLLALSRVGRAPAAVEVVEMDAVLRQARTSLATVIEEAGAEVVAPPLPSVKGEPALLAAVFQNLIGNAVKFHEDGRPPRVEIGVERDGAEWVFSCADDGIGIEPQYAERIFMVFQRLHPKDVYAGTGIGLALCRKIVEHHGGRIWLDTASDGGRTTFRFTLPAIEESPTP